MGCKIQALPDNASHLLEMYVDTPVEHNRLFQTVDLSAYDGPLYHGPLVLVGAPAHRGKRPLDVWTSHPTDSTGVHIGP